MAQNRQVSGEVQVNIDVFDFDGTLVKTPGREQAEKDFLAATGNPWPHIGFYGRLESLIPPVFPEKPGDEFLIQEVAEICRAKECDLRVLMTGRPYKLRNRVLEICTHYGLAFGLTYFQGQKDCPGINTFECKTSGLRQLLTLNPQRLRLWEDREDHFVLFEELFRTFRAERPEVEFVLNRVVS
jgi:hypothetical protein